MNAAPDRVIRVFVSSTFLDMKAERDELAKRVFPALRKLCDHRGVVCREVDLRWGITDEETAEGRVLPICLEEIRRCRPYFLGIVAERYGWVPNVISDQLIEREPWLQAHRSHSVTELEILHGVLNDPGMAGHAFFYFRDPAYLDRLPEGAVRSHYRSEDPCAQEKLIALKQRIRDSGFPVHEDYRDPVEFGQLVLQRLTAMVESLFPEGSPPDALDREAAEHEAYARARRGVYVGREEYSRRLDAHAAGDGPPLVVLGESGGGKSALLANWVQQWRGVHPEACVIEHYAGASPDSADGAAMLRRILGEFHRQLGVKTEIPPHAEAIRLAFADALGAAAAKGRVVLVLDALNQLEDRDGVPDLVWLPPEIPANLRLVVSTLPGRPLDNLAKRGWPVLRVEPLTPAERQTVIANCLAQFTRKLPAPETARIAAAPQCANPLYLRALLEELRLHGERETLPGRISHYLEAATPQALYGRILARYEQDFERGRPGLVRDAMTALWASRRGLTEEELLALLGGASPLPGAIWAPLSLALESGLLVRSGLLGFGHDHLRQAVEQRYVADQDARHAAHLWLAQFFDGRKEGWRRIEEVPWQLAEAGEWERLATLLAKPKFFMALWGSREVDARVYWAAIERHSALRMETCYRYILESPRADPKLAWWLSILLGESGRLDQAAALRGALVEHFREAGDLGNLQACLGNQSVILSDRGDLDGAMAAAKEQERLCRQLGDPYGIATSLGHQALFLKRRGDLDGAMALHKEQEDFSRHLGDRAGLAASLCNQALLLKKRGDLDGAMALHRESERLCRQLGDSAGLSTNLCNQGTILRMRGDLDGAMALHKQSERLDRQLGDTRQLQICLFNQALTLKERGDLAGAMALHKEEELLCRQLGNLAHLQICLHKQALILMASGEMKGALALLKESERLCRQLGDSAELAVLLANQAGLLSVNLSRHAEALPLAGEACRLADEHGLALRRQFGQLRDQIAQHFAKPRPVGGFASCPHPAADPDRAVRLNLEYQANRKRWDALSWWQRLRTKRPEPPAGI